MATRQPRPSEPKPSESGVVGRLAGRGEEAMNRLMDELGRNSKVTDALTRALAAKGMLDTASRTALTQVGLAPAEDVRELRRRVMDLEKRVGELEGGSSRSRKAAPKKSTGKRATTAKTTRTTTRSRSAPET